MNPAEAYDVAVDSTVRCADMLRLLTLAIDGGADEIGAEERSAIAEGTQRALDLARSAREAVANMWPGPS